MKMITVNQDPIATKDGYMDCYFCRKETTAPFCSIFCASSWYEANPSLKLTWYGKIVERCP